MRINRIPQSSRLHRVRDTSEHVSRGDGTLLLRVPRSNLRYKIQDPPTLTHNTSLRASSSVLRAEAPESNHTVWIQPGRLRKIHSQLILSISTGKRSIMTHSYIQGGPDVTKCARTVQATLPSSRLWNPSARCPSPWPALSCCRICTEPLAGMHS